MAASERLSEIDSTAECSYSTDSRPSLLDRLKCADPSVHARKRKVKSNPPVGAKKSQGHSLLSHTYTPKSISPKQRVREFPDEGLTVSGSNLFCTACREEIGLKATVIRLHCKSKKHTSGKERLKQKKSMTRILQKLSRPITTKST